MFLVTPQKPAYPLQIHGWKMNFSLNMAPFGEDVSFRGCMCGNPSEKNTHKTQRVFLHQFFVVGFPEKKHAQNEGCSL